MIIMHAMKTLPGLLSSALVDRLRVMPAVVVTGARWPMMEWSRSRSLR
jgi:hypothetical protein